MPPRQPEFFFSLSMIHLNDDFICILSEKPKDTDQEENSLIKMIIDGIFKYKINNHKIIN